MLKPNGCGSSHWALLIFRIPRWISEDFFDCCNKHDTAYQNQEDKKRADDNLYNCMYKSAYLDFGFKKWIKLKIADIIYWCLNTKLSNLAYNQFKKD